jgi:gluconokinase
MTPRLIMPPLVLVLMGVSGSGKTTVGALLAGRLGAAFADADDFHSPANIAKMHAGIPLDDADRQPWLAAIAARIESWRAAHRPGLVTCSALKRTYRDIIKGGHEDVRLVYLKGEKSLIARRLAARHGHFMPAALLDSQFAALEEPAPDEGVLTITIDKPPAVLVEEILQAIGATS